MLEKKKRQVLAQSQRYTSRCGIKSMLALIHLSFMVKQKALIILYQYLDMANLTQVDKDADIKRLRQGLNFKAKPVPGFYRGHGLSKTPSVKVRLDI